MTTENVKLQLKIRVCFEKNHMSTPPPFSITDYKNQVPHKHCRSTEGQTRGVEQFLDLIGRVLNWSKSVTGFRVSFEKAMCFRRHDMTVWLSGLISFFCLNSHFWCCESLQIPSFSITILSGYLVPSLTKRPAPVDSFTLVAYFRKGGCI